MRINRMQNLRTAAAILAFVTLAGCGGGGKAAGAQPPKTVTASATSSSSPSQTPSTSTATTTATPADPRLPVGHAWISDDNSVTITVQSVKSVVPVSPQGGAQLAGILVKACVKLMPAGHDNSPVQFSWGPWSVLDADSQNFPATGTTYDSYPKPMFPNGTGWVSAGECVKGWVYFDVNKGTHVAEVRYASDGGHAVWRT